MSNLFEYSRSNTHLSAPDALRQLVQTYQTNSQNSMMNNAATQFNSSLQQAGTPGGNFNGPQQFASPAGAHLNLPNTASPASMNMSPAMQSHSLQQANSTGSQGASANTSPNVSNKRRRPSAVKMEDGEGPTPETNGPKVKASPRVGGKRQKPGP